MIFDSSTVPAAEFERQTGWAIRPEGACRDDRCVPLSGLALEPVDIGAVAERLNMPLVHDEAAGIWALGPEAGGRALTSVVSADFTLPDAAGKMFRLSSLRGQKVLIAAWASW